jgi:hypothetical protein
MPVPNPALQAAILQVVDNQLREDTPPETRLTLARLHAAGYSEQEAKRLIGVVVLHEIFDTLKHRTPYNEARYVAALRRLPQLPNDQEAAG